MNYKKLIDKYLFFEILKNSVLFNLILVLIFTLFHFLDELTKDYAMSSKIEYILYTIPATTNILAGLGIFIASIVTVANFNERRELQIYLTGGVSLKIFIRKIVYIGFILSFLITLLGESFSPFFSEKSLKIKAEATGRVFSNSDNNIWIKNDDLFININSSRGGEEFSGISIFEIDEKNKLNKFSYSEKGLLEFQGLKLINTEGVIFSNLNNFIYPENIQKEESSILMGVGQVEKISKDERTMNILELIQISLMLTASGLKNELYVTEIFSRLLRPFVTIGLILIALPMTLNLQRNTSLSKLILTAISLALIFNLISKLLGIYAINFGLNVYIASLLPLLITFFFGFVSLLKSKILS